MAIYINYPLGSSTIAIVLNGDREAKERFREQFIHYELIIICDGAWYDAIDMINDILEPLREKELNNSSEAVLQTNPNFHSKIISLGDGDSILEQGRCLTQNHDMIIQDDIPDNFIHIADQDTTDFEKALLWLQSYQNLTDRNIDVYWANGGDLDHTLGNLSLAAKYHNDFNLHFFTKNQYYRYVVDDVIITNAHGATISFYPFPDLTVKRSTGLVYPMFNYDMKVNTQQSLRNKVNADMVNIHGKGSYFMFLELKS